MTQQTQEPAFRDQPNSAETDEKLLAVGILSLLGFELCVMVLILWAVGASLAFSASIITFCIVTTVGSLAIVTRVMWTPWQRRYPAQPIERDAVTRTWQSFSLGRLGRFNHCLRISIDAHHLHVHPFVVFHWFGARTISLPWNDMHDLTPSRFSSMMHARLGTRRITGPNWAMKLADTNG